MPGTVGVELVGTVTVEASGTASIIVAKSNVPFKNLTVSTRPVQSDTKYTYEVFVNGELSESHDYPDDDDRVVAHSMWPHLVWPANIGTNSIPKFFDPDKEDHIGFPVVVRITSAEAERRVFEIYSCYEEFDAPRFGKLKQT